MTAGRAQEPTAEQLAAKACEGIEADAYAPDHVYDDARAALSELVARLATAEKECDEVTAELAALLAEFKLQRDERDRLTAALNGERLYRELTEGLPEGTLPREPEGELRIERDSFGTRYVREALNPGDAT